MTEEDQICIRYITPREAFRLMGQDDETIDRIQDCGISKTQQYKLAGNSIVVNVLEDIFKEIYINQNFGKCEKRPSLEDFIKH